MTYPGVARVLARWRSQAGIAQSAMVGGLVVASLAITTGLVAFGPPVGSVIGDKFVCVLFGAGAGHPCESPQPLRPPPPAPVWTAAAPVAGQYDLDGVSNPSPVTPGGSGYTYSGAPLTFAQCWERSNTVDYLTRIWNRVCTTPDGTVYDCRTTQRTVVIPWPRSRNLCRPATETTLPDLVRCAPTDTGAQKCAPVTLDSTVRTPGRTDLFYEDPALRGLPGFQALQQACRVDPKKCNADLDEELAGLLAKLRAANAKYAGCAPQLTNTQTELHTVVDPVTGDPAVLLRSDNGWVDPADPPADPAAKAAILYLLTGAVERQAAASTGTRRPGEQVPGLWAMTQAVSDTLPGLSTPDGLTCAGISAALGHINDGVAGPDESLGYSSFCAEPAADGSCARWSTSPVFVGEEGDPATEIGTANSLQLTEEAEDTLPATDLVPGRPAATYDEAVAYCTDHSQECATSNAAELAQTEASLYGTMRDLGLCDTAAACSAFVDGVAAEAGGCDAGTTATSWTRQALRAPPRWAIVTGVAGVTVCGIIAGGLAGSAIGGVPGAAAGGVITASLVAAGIAIGEMRAATRARPEGVPPAVQATLGVMFANVQAQLDDLRTQIAAGGNAVAQDIQDIEAQLPAPADQLGFFGRLIQRLLHPHQA